MASRGTDGTDGSAALAAPGTNRWRESALLVALLLALSAIVFSDVFFGGKTLAASNTLAAALPSGHYGGANRPRFMSLYDVTPAVLEEPYLELKRHALSDGVLPLWNPHQAGGYPFLATMESSLFFLPELVLYLTPSPYAWDLFFVVRLLLAGLSTYWLVRTLGFDRLAGATAAVAYMFSGPLVSWIANVTLNADVLSPLLLLTLELVLRSPKRRYVVATAVVMFQVVAGGHPEHAFFAFLSGAIFAVCRLVQGACAGSRWQACSRLALAASAGFGLSAVQLWPFADYLARAWHVHGPKIGLESLRFAELATVLFPWYDSRELVSYDGWVFRTWPGGWLGVMTVTLALATLFTRRADSAARPFQLLFLVYLFKLFGIPPVSWLGHLPIFGLVRFPLHSTQSLALAAAVLCGVAVAALAREEVRLRAFGAALVLVVAAALVLAYARPPKSSPTVAFGVGFLLVATLSVGLAARARRRLSARALAVGITALLCVELVVLVPRERAARSETFVAPPYVEFLRAQPGRFRVFGLRGCLFPNTASAFGLDDLGLYEGLFVDRFARFVNTLVDPRNFAAGSFHAFRSALNDPGNRYLDLLNLKYLIVPKGVLIGSADLERFHLARVYQGEVQVLERKRALPRATVRFVADVVADGGAALARLAAGYDFERRVLIERGATISTPSIESANGTGEVEETGYGLNRKSYRVRCTTACYLVIADVHYPGWRAQIDGRQAEVLRADYLLQAVAVSAGEHVVALEFRPQSVLGGAAISLASLALLGVWASLGARRRRRGAA